MSEIILGKVYVVKDDIDTDQIIPAEHLSLVPTIASEYRELGSHALCGLPVSEYPQRFVEATQHDSEYVIIIAGRNFGCGSSREHAPIALGAAGARAIVAESYARIFFRNCVATGAVYPMEGEYRLCDHFETGDVVQLNIASGELRAVGSSAAYPLRPLGDVQEIVDSGGLFNYARSRGLISKERLCHDRAI